MFTGQLQQITLPMPSPPLLLLPNTYRAFYGSFSGLHPLQQKAIEPILNKRDIILQSATGSGKTEAVLAPCLERIIHSDRSLKEGTACPGIAAMLCAVSC